MNYITIDDEALARRGIKRHGDKISYLNCLGEFESIMAALPTLENSQVDLIILDIQMPHLTGIEFLKNHKNLPLVIIHTAYPNYALEGYALDVMDYLVKPVTFDRFYQAVQKTQDYFKLRQEKQRSLAAERDFVFIKCEKKYEKINFADLLYVEGMQNYSVFYTKNEKFVTLLSLRKVEDLLPKQLFIRAHKSFIIALDKIKSLEGNAVTIHQRFIPVGREQRKELLAWLQG
ncbi:MAG: LytTR family DNA-binding domain-containing protein [Bacteroidota bacterium]